MMLMGLQWSFLEITSEKKDPFSLALHVPTARIDLHYAPQYQMRWMIVPVYARTCLRLLGMAVLNYKALDIVYNEQSGAH